MRSSQRVLAAATWIGAILILVLGYARIETHEVRRVRSAEVEASGLSARIDRSRAIVRDRVALRAARKNIVADIGAQARYGAGDDLGPLLASLDLTARRSGLAILAVEPEGGAGEPSKDDWLRSRAVKIVLRGTFVRFLAFLPELSTADPLILLRDVAIVPVGRSKVRPLLVFTLDIAAYTVRTPTTKE